MHPALAQTSGLAEQIVFGILAAAIVVGALTTITRRNPVTAVMALVGTFFALAGMYATLNAHFLAVLQVMVYAGAIMVLFIFVVMILNRDEISPVSFHGISRRAVGVLVSGYLVYRVVEVVWRLRGSTILRGPMGEPAADFGTVATVGASLFKEFMLPFEAISVLLLVAIVGGVIVSRSVKQEVQAEEAAARRLHFAHAVRDEERVEPAGAASASADPPHPPAAAHS